MALTSRPPGAPDAPPATWLPTLGAPPAPARAPAQVASLVLCTATIALVAVAGGEPALAVPTTLALVAGVVTGLTTEAHRLVTHFAGVVMALVAMVLTAIALAAIGSSLGAEVPAITVVAVGLVVLGLDWRTVNRLRVLPFLTGLFVVPVVGSSQGWAYPAALVWLALAIGTLWLLQDDEGAARARPTPLVPSRAAATPGRPGDVLGTLGVALLLGVVAALLLGRPSCSGDRRPDLGSGAGSDMSFGDPSSGGGSGGGGASGPGTIPPERRSGGGTDGGEVGSAGGEREIPIGDGGERHVADPRTGERHEIGEEGGRTVVRDETGRVVGELDEDGVVAGDRAVGDAQRYRVDGEGRYYVETPDGERLHLGQDADGNPVLTDRDGEVVARPGPSDDHLVIRDPDGDVLVPDPDGDGQIPVPDGALREALPGSRGTTYRQDGDALIATDPDGEVRTYDRDPAGRERVGVDVPGSPSKTYVYDDSGDGLVIEQYDEDGRFERRYRVDPDGVIIEGDPGADGGRPGAGGTTLPADVAPGATEPDPPPADDGRGGPSPWLLVALVTAVAAAVAGAWWWIRRRPDPRPDLGWAEDLVARIEAHGAAHGRARGRDETITAYAAALGDGEVPDPRLAAVGGALSAALFDRVHPPPEEQARLRYTVDEIIEAHPVPTRSDRRRARKGTEDAVGAR